MNPPPPPYFKIISAPLLASPHPHDFLKSPIPTTNQQKVIQVFLINRSATVKLSSINIIHMKQQHNVGFFILTFTLKCMQVIVTYMLGNAYI